jgi:hypothetical protein
MLYTNGSFCGQIFKLWRLKFYVSFFCEHIPFSLNCTHEIVQVWITSALTHLLQANTGIQPEIYVLTYPLTEPG